METPKTSLFFNMHWIDVCCILFGLAAVLFRYFKYRKSDNPLTFEAGNIITVFGNGTGLFLAIILMSASFSPFILNQLENASKQFIFISGLTCFITFIREIFRK